MPEDEEEDEEVETWLMPKAGPAPAPPNPVMAGLRCAVEEEVAVVLCISRMTSFTSLMYEFSSAAKSIEGEGELLAADAEEEE